VFNAAPVGAPVCRFSTRRCGTLTALQCVAAALLLGGNGPVWAQTPSGGTGALRGVVRDSSRQAIPQVRVSVSPDTTRYATTDSSGAFFMPGVAAGLRRVHFRRLGFAPASFSVLVEADEEVVLQVELAPLPTRLELIEVSRPFSPALGRVGFYERRRQRELGILAGTFITPEEIQARRAPKLTYLLESIPGLIIDREIPRGRAVGRDFRRCQMAVFLDGIELSVEDVRGGINQLVNVFDVGAIEVYTSPSWSPERFQSTRINNPCGSIVIWTRAGY
jgi:hypothetical protein